MIILEQKQEMDLNVKIRIVLERKMNRIREEEKWNLYGWIKQRIEMLTKTFSQCLLMLSLSLWFDVQIIFDDIKKWKIWWNQFVKN